MFTIQAYFKRFISHLESSEHSDTYILPPICTNWLIFKKGTFFILFFLDLPTNPIVPQVKFCDVITSFHY